MKTFLFILSVCAGAGSVCGLDVPAPAATAEAGGTAWCGAAASGISNAVAACEVIKPSLMLIIR